MKIADFDPARVLRTFISHGVNFVTVGGLAVTVWGADVRMMLVLETCYERSAANYLALAAALNELEARMRGTNEPGDVSITTIATNDVLRLETNAGAVDCVAKPQGTSGYSDLIANAVEFSFGDGLNVRVASVSDLLRIARATDNAYGRATAEILSSIKEV